MEDTPMLDIPDESMRHINALLARHPPGMIQRMFSQTIETRRHSNASSFMSTNTISSNATSSSGSSWRSRLSMASTFSSATVNSDTASSIASSNSSRSRMRRTEPRSYPTGLDPTRPVPAILTPSSDVNSPIDFKIEPGYTPTDEMASPSLFPDDKSQSQGGEPYMFCTYCAEQKSQKTFKAKSDWKKHEMRMHETGEDWPCIVNGCNRIFDRQKDFIKHHQRYHSGRPLPSLTDIGITLLPRKVFGCGFDKCKEVSIGWDERCDHVAKHMKNGATYDQWKYSNVIRNLIRQEALHDTWKELINCLDERLRESRSQISWCPDNSRILRQKLQCCDLRPSREEVLITAMSLRADIQLDPAHQQLPAGFVTPSRDSVPNVDKVSREARMQLLNGQSNPHQSRLRLVGINIALLQVIGSGSHVADYDCGASPFIEPPQTPAVDSAARRISYMDVDPGDYLHSAQPSIPDLPPELNSHNMNTQSMSSQNLNPPSMNSQNMSSQNMSSQNMSPPNMNSQSMSQPSMSQPTMSQPSMSQPTMGQPTMSQPSMNQPNMNTQPMSSQSMSAPPPHTPVMDNDQHQQAQMQQGEYAAQPKPPENPLGWCYPSYFDAAPQFEESQYYERPSLGQMISKPLHKIGNRLGGSRSNSTHSRSSSHMSQGPPDVGGAEYIIQNPATSMSMRPPSSHHQQQQQPQPQHHMAHLPPGHMMIQQSPSQYRNGNQIHDPMGHMYTTQG